MISVRLLGPRHVKMVLCYSDTQTALPPRGCCPHPGGGCTSPHRCHHPHVAPQILVFSPGEAPEALEEVLPPTPGSTSLALCSSVVGAPRPAPLSRTLAHATFPPPPSSPGFLCTSCTAGPGPACSPISVCPTGSPNRPGWGVPSGDGPDGGGGPRQDCLFPQPQFSPLQK